MIRCGLTACNFANQLIREDNGFINQTVTYTYDAWGNILTKSEYPYTTGTLGTPSNSVNYTYTNSAWGDQLTSYNGETITYDAMGNPVNYRGYATSFEGKQLVSAVKTGKNITFAYDENGLRTQKTVNGVTTNYYYNGSVLMSLTQGDTSLLFSYDAAGNVVAVEVQSDSWSIDGETLYYIRNGQGDIMGLIDSSGRTVIEYRYDTWGRDCSLLPDYQEYLDLQELNPFRYRGYVYDTETGWYYLQSRYYDPAVCRFISADVLLSTGQGVLGHNTYAYCLNNPVNRSDPSGCASKKDRLLTEEDKLYGSYYKYPTGFFKTADEAAIAVAPFLYNCTMETNNECMAVIYSITLHGTKQYYVGPILTGKHDNVVAPTLCSWLVDLCEPMNVINIEGFVHSHPYCNGHLYTMFSGFIGDEGAAILMGSCYLIEPSKGFLYKISARDVLCAYYNRRHVSESMIKYRIHVYTNLKQYASENDCE